jgi:hypothetical protein
MPLIILWIVVVIGSDFMVEARWAPMQFPDREQCETWLATTLRSGPVKLRPELKAECRPVGSTPNDIEE